MRRRSVRSFLPTIAVFLASLQAARAGASAVDAAGLSTPTHHRGASNAPVAQAAPVIQGRAAPVLTVAVSVAITVRRSAQANAAQGARAEMGDRTRAGGAGRAATGWQVDAGYRALHIAVVPASRRALGARSDATVRSFLHGNARARAPCAEARAA